ncbi:Secretory component protein SHR3 [Hypsizygus marmoreus]|uniref:Secretory component protein SHR3 n=1 Tax=Hypsizygus marmoreus TaxID=39966 RepID=A0A369JFY7_HYPMA|nr:Secretory component protein SHR3 [Hypsizygus marmoreus]
MGFKHAAVLAPVSFFLGVFFICFNVDHRILWAPLTEDVVADGFQFYTTFFNAPPAIKALLHGMVGVGLVGLLSKLHKWDESAMFFDGSCLGAYVLGIAVYITVTIPALQTIVTPLEGVDAYEDRVEAMRVLSAGNVIIMVCLGAILALQAGQEYARRAEVKALAIIEEEERRKATPIEKKDQ